MSDRTAVRMAHRIAVLKTHLLQRKPARSKANSDQPTVNSPVLDGVTVVELATVVAAPSACALLADFGASVIKIESPAGDMWREEARTIRPDGPAKDTVGGIFFENTNRGKKSVQLDLRNEAAVAVLRKLLAKADVFVTNVRQQGLERLGLDYESIANAYPKLIYAHLTAWGRSGSAVNDAGYDSGAFWAASGMEDLVRADDKAEMPRYPGGFGDHTTAQSLLAGICMALYHKERTGLGQLVDASLYRSGIWCMGVPILLAQHGYGGAARRSRIEAGNPVFNNYICKDGIAVQLLGLQLERHLPNLLRVLGLAEFCAQDKRFSEPRALIKNRRVLIAMIDQAFKSRPYAEWHSALRDADVWHCRINRIEDISNDPQANAVGAFTTAPGLEPEFKFLASPFKLNASEYHSPRSLAPALGQHNEEVLGTVGISPSSEVNGSISKLKLLPQRKK